MRRKSSRLTFETRTKKRINSNETILRLRKKKNKEITKRADDSALFRYCLLSAMSQRFNIRFGYFGAAFSVTVGTGATRVR